MVGPRQPRPALLLVTTADTVVDKAVAWEAAKRNVALFHAIVLEKGGWSASLYLDYANDLARAYNQWMIDAWLEKDERLKGALIVPTHGRRRPRTLRGRRQRVRRRASSARSSRAVSSTYPAPTNGSR